MQKLPKGAVIDGEIVALDDRGKPNFNLLQNYRQHARFAFYVFDVTYLRGENLMRRAFVERRATLEEIIAEDETVRVSEAFDVKLSRMLDTVQKYGLEGVVAKRKDSIYESGRRSGSWSKFRINMGQEFVVGGFVPGGALMDSIIIGFYRSDELIYCARVRAGFDSASRRELQTRVKPLITSKCPFVNLPEKTAGRWGQGLTADKMRECIWVKPEVVVRVEFLEWTDGDHLRHCKFDGIREDKKPRQVVKEHADDA
jgi:ATP-dependent DNA ligase